MKRALSLFLFAALLLSFSVLSGCGKAEKNYDSAGELQFLRKAQVERNSNYSHISIEDGTCLCVIPDNAEGEITIPEEYDGRPVRAVTGGKNAALEKIVFECDQAKFKDCCNGSLPESVTFKKDVESINSSFEGCDCLTSVTFKKDVKAINLSFSDCASLTSVTFEGTVKSIDRHSFSACTALTEIVVPDDSVYATKENEHVLIITKSAKAYLGTLPIEGITAHAKQTLGAAFDESKHIKDKDAAQFADLLNAPVFYSTVCADCHADEYSVDKVPKRAGIQYYSIDETNLSLDEPAFTEEKRQRIESGADHIVYCLAEPLKGGSAAYYPEDGKDQTKQIFYHLNFRLSFWDYTDDTLLGWLVVSTGFESNVIRSYGKRYYYSMLCGDAGTEDFLASYSGEIPTALSVVKGCVY